MGAMGFEPISAGIHHMEGVPPCGPAMRRPRFYGSSLQLVITGTAVTAPSADPLAITTITGAREDA